MGRTHENETRSHENETAMTLACAFLGPRDLGRVAEVSRATKDMATADAPWTASARRAFPLALDAPRQLLGRRLFLSMRADCRQGSTRPSARGSSTIRCSRGWWRRHAGTGAKCEQATLCSRRGENGAWWRAM